MAVALMILGVSPCNEPSAKTETVCFPSLYITARLSPHTQAAPHQTNNITPISRGIHFTANYLSSPSYCLNLFTQIVEKQLKWSQRLSNNMTATGFFSFVPLQARKVSSPDGY